MSEWDWTVAIVGSRDVSPQQRDSILNLLGVLEGHYLWSHHQAGSMHKITVISGGAKGVDELVRETFQSVQSVCAQYGYEPWFYFEEYLPSTKRWEGAGGYKSRNLQIAEACDELYCIRSRQSESYGSGWTADRVEEMDKPVWRYWV